MIYKLAFTIDTSVNSNKVNTATSSLNEAADVDGNLPAQIVVTDDFDDQGMDNNTQVTYSLALDSEGQPYINVAITSPGGYLAAGVIGDDPSGAGGTYAGFEYKLVSGTPALAGYRAAAVADSNYTKVSDARTALYAATGVTSFYTGDGSTNETSGNISLTSVNTTDKILADTGTDEHIQYFLVDSATDGTVKNGATKTFWYGINEYTDTTPANAATSIIMTGNMSVKLSDGLVAVLPVSGGAISIIFL